jgi:P2 family phage contractile tail tube protein
VFNGYADPSLSGQQIRFLGAYQSDDDGAVTAVEVVVRGRHQEIDMGNAKPGENTEHTIKTIPTYYKLTINGRVAIEIDILNMILMVNGVDRNAQLRAALGL